MVNFIFSLCYASLALIIGVILFPAGKYARGYLLGVKLQSDALCDDEVIKLIAAYKKAVWLTLVSSFLLFIPVYFLGHHVSVQVLYFIVIFLLECLLFEAPYVHYHIKLRAIKKAKNYGDTLTYQDESEDEANWKCGLCYYNPNDPRLMVNKKVGIGLTLNYAHSSAKNWTIGTIVFVVLTLIGSIGPLFIHEFSSPTLKIIESQTAEIQCFQYGTTFDLDEVTQINLVQTLPNSTKLNGIATNSIARGRIAFKGMGATMAYVYKKTPPFIILTFEDGYIVYNEKDEAKTKEVYEMLQNNLKNLE